VLLRGNEIFHALVMAKLAEMIPPNGKALETIKRSTNISWYRDIVSKSETGELVSASDCIPSPRR
jgi:hypothetical protein